MQIPCDPLPFLKLNQLRYSLIRILKLALELPLLISAVRIERKQNHDDQAYENEGKLGEKQRILSSKAIVDRNERTYDMNRVQGEETGSILNVSDKERQKNRKIDVAEQHRHRNRYDDLHTRPEVYEPSFGNEGQPITNKEQDDHNYAGYDLIGRGRPKNKIKRQNTENYPNVWAEACLFMKNLIPLVHGLPPFFYAMQCLRLSFSSFYHIRLYKYLFSW